ALKSKCAIDMPSSFSPRAPALALVCTKESEECLLLGSKAALRHNRRSGPGIGPILEERAGKIDLDHGGVDVTLAASRRGVVDTGRHAIDRGDHVAIGCRLRACRGAERAERPRGQYRARPGPEVLGGEIEPGDLVQVVVDVARV